MPDPISPNVYNLKPINFDKWNGQVINPIEVYYKQSRGEYKSLVRLQKSQQAAKDKPQAKKGDDDDLDSLLDDLPDM